MTDPDSDLYPTLTFRDPLLFPQFISIVDPSSIHEQVHADWLLQAYINALDQEIVDDIEEFAEFKEPLVELFDAVRTHGWAVFQAYKGPNDEDIYKIFTSMHRTDWIKELNEETNKQERVGIKVHWFDDLGNNYDDQLYFDDRANENGTIIGKAYLVIWKQGTGNPLRTAPFDSAWAIADLNTAILSLAIQIRQIQSALSFSATNPYFLHFKYGDSITTAQRNALKSQMQFANTTNGIGAKMSVLNEIVPIENSATEKTILALDQLVSFYCAATRLPISYFLGEKQTGSGLDSGGAENVDEVKVAKKKEFILQHFLTPLEAIFTEVFGTSLPTNLGSYYSDQIEEEKQHQEQREDMQNQPAKAESK